MTINVRPPQRGATASLDRSINRFAAWLARHWLAAFNILVAVFIGLPFLAPVLMEAGATRAAGIIYKMYAPTCHQLPERSFFLFGPRAVYSAEELEAMGDLPAELTQVQRMALRWEGAANAGFKVATCERDVAIYGSILIGGLAFGALRTRYIRRGRNIPKMPVWLFVVMLLPIAIDGTTQLFGLRESTWELRMITGAIMGFAVIWLAYPYIDLAMADVAHTAATQHGA